MRTYYLSVIDGSRKGCLAACLRAVLRVCSWGYAFVIFLIRGAYQTGIARQSDLGCPVISVGNLTWGGTGKTPLTAWIVQELLNHGKRPAVLIRGYMPGRNAGTAACVLSDEARLLSGMFEGRVPVIACRDRIRGAGMIPAEYGCDVIVLDDGFQHWRVRRDLDIVVINAMDPFGNGAVIPRGSLREPLSALRRADVCVISRADMDGDAALRIRQRVMTAAPAMVFAGAGYEPLHVYDLRTGACYGLDHLQGRPVVLVSGIGSPRGFERVIQGLGADVRDHIMYPDHWVYTFGDCARVSARLRETGAAVLIMTEKDRVKCRDLVSGFPPEVQVLSLVITMRILNGEEVLRHAVASVFSS